MNKQIILAVGLLSLSACGETASTLSLLPDDLPPFQELDLDDDDLSMGIDDDLMDDVVLVDDPMDDELAATSGDVSFGSLLNNLRISNGDRVVTYDSRIDAAAQGHADDMVDRNYFAHDSPEGETVQDRLIAQGYDPSAWGENIARTQQTEEQALDAWINSPPHNALLQANSVSNFGLGVAGSGAQKSWVLVMATEK